MEARTDNSVISVSVVCQPPLSSRVRLTIPPPVRLSNLILEWILPPYRPAEFSCLFCSSPSFSWLLAASPSPPLPKLDSPPPSSCPPVPWSSASLSTPPSATAAAIPLRSSAAATATASPRSFFPFLRRERKEGRAATTREREGRGAGTFRHHGHLRLLVGKIKGQKIVTKLQIRVEQIYIVINKKCCRCKVHIRQHSLEVFY